MESIGGKNGHLEVNKEVTELSGNGTWGGSSRGGEN